MLVKSYLFMMCLVLTAIPLFSNAQNLSEAKRKTQAEQRLRQLESAVERTEEGSVIVRYQDSAGNQKVLTIEKEALANARSMQELPELADLLEDKKDYDAGSEELLANHARVEQEMEREGCWTRVLVSWSNECDNLRDRSRKLADEIKKYNKGMERREAAVESLEKSLKETKTRLAQIHLAKQDLKQATSALNIARDEAFMQRFENVKDQIDKMQVNGALLSLDLKDFILSEKINKQKMNEVMNSIDNKLRYSALGEYMNNQIAKITSNMCSLQSMCSAEEEKGDLKTALEAVTKGLLRAPAGTTVEIKDSGIKANGGISLGEGGENIRLKGPDNKNYDNRGQVIE